MKLLERIFSFVISFAIPFLIIITSIQLLFTPLFLSFEYHLPGFPEDSYGFTTDDRMTYGNLSLRYLLSSADISILADQTFTDSTPLFNQRELSHMVDVKNVLQGMLLSWRILAFFFFISTIIAWRRGWLNRFLAAISRGSIFTLGLIGLILIGVVTSFDWLFTAFHGLFFEGDSWLFYYSDTLIRLFPIRFWSDAFIAVGVVSVILAMGSIFFIRKFISQISVN